jgi:hypothetical protein
MLWCAPFSSISWCNQQRLARCHCAIRSTAPNQVKLSRHSRGQCRISRPKPTEQHRRPPCQAACRDSQPQPQAQALAAHIPSLGLLVLDSTWTTPLPRTRRLGTHGTAHGGAKQQNLTSSSHHQTVGWTDSLQSAECSGRL